VNNKTRKKALKYFGIPLIVSFVIVGVTAQKTQKTQSDTKQEVKAEELATTTEDKSTKLGDIKIYYIDVGQGDSELIQVDGKNILIDAGTSDKKALNYLKSIGITKIDYSIATHPHEDHIGSMDDVINTFNIGTFYSPKVTATTKTYENMVNALKNKNLKLTVPKVGDQLTIGNATLTFLAPNNDKYEDVNNYSIVVKLKYGNTSFLFDGDAEAISESEILAKQLDIQADVIKLGHHGSESSTSQAFLDKVNPKYAIISCGKNNDYGHPHKVTLDKLNAKEIKTFRTDLNGTIIATSNGTDITFNTNPVDSSINIAGVVPSKTERVAKDITEADANNTTSNNSSSNTNSTSNNNSTTTNEPAQGDRIVYWTSGGKSYHYDKNCPTLKKSKNILSGKASECPKTDPCDKCAK
jgi:beta-lactamase superfamily II metal-dependent hydrolase